MKIVVDEMPKTSSECLFNEPRTTSKDHPYCCLNRDYANVCTDPKKCPFLIGINDMFPTYPKVLTMELPIPDEYGTFQRWIQKWIDEIKEKDNATE